jgi:hypothetical protein
MADQIMFRPGEKRHFVAARTFSLGSTGMTVPKGADIMFDGTVVEFGGTTFNHPQFRGAIRAGWAVVAEHYDASDRSAERPVAANIQVRHPTNGGNPMTGGNRAAVSTPTVTENDEREVGNVRVHAEATQDRNRGHVHGQHIEANPGSSVQMQDGVPVRKLKTSNTGEKSKGQRTVLTAETAGSRIREAESPQPIDAGRGVTEEEMLERMAPDQREAYLAEKSALKARYVDVDTDAQRPVVATIKSTQKGTQSTEGMVAKVTTGGGTETWDGAGTGGKDKVTTTTIDGIKVTNTNGPSNREQPHPRSAEAQKPVMLKDGTADMRLKVAKQICPDFPTNYDFGTAPRKKLARLQADYEDRPDVIRAVFAAESDDFKAVLLREFPTAFQG